MFLPANITLQFGDSGDFVAELQRRLATVNAHPEHGVNGAFDGLTVNSVSSFQSRVGIRADGIAGPETLRRLNGVISGDTSWTNNNAEEEARKAAEEAARLRQAEMLRAEEARQQQAEIDRRAAEAAQLAQQHAPSPAQSMYRSNEFASPQPAPQPNAEQAHGMPLNMGEMLAQMMQQNASAPQPAPLSPAEVFAKQIQQQQAPAHVAPAQPVSPGPAELLAQQIQQQTQKPPAPLSAADLLIQQLQQQTKPQQPQPQRVMAEAPQNVPMVAAEERPRSLVGRAIQKMDEMFQRLAQHFESRLPPDVLREVERIGQRMARSGVVEAGISDAPETARGATPARGPEQQQTAQRG